jgi:hypothetical protein
MLSTHKELAQKLAQLESKLQNHDEQIIALIDAIRDLMIQPEPPAKPAIGFVTEERARKPRARSGRSRHNAEARRDAAQRTTAEFHKKSLSGGFLQAVAPIRN